MLNENICQSMKLLNDLEEADFYPEEFLLLFVLSLQETSDFPIFEFLQGANAPVLLDGPKGKKPNKEIEVFAERKQIDSGIK